MTRGPATDVNYLALLADVQSQALENLALLADVQSQALGCLALLTDVEGIYFNSYAGARRKLRD